MKREVIMRRKIMSEKTIDVRNKYIQEIMDITAKLNQLEKGRIYELTNAQIDGYLATNVNQLRKMIAGLIVKIEYGKDSIEDEILEIMGDREC